MSVPIGPPVQLKWSIRYYTTRLAFVPGPQKNSAKKSQALNISKCLHYFTIYSFLCNLYIQYITSTRPQKVPIAFKKRSKYRKSRYMVLIHANHLIDYTQLITDSPPAPFSSFITSNVQITCTKKVC